MGAVERHSPSELGGGGCCLEISIFLDLFTDRSVAKAGPCLSLPALCVPKRLCLH